jgi:galactose mutarotase-like enzyme
MNKIATGSYKDVKSIVLENDYLRVILLPDWGSKIVSIWYKNIDHELLWQNPGKEYIKTGYGEPFEKGEFSGFDEMFPTISRCSYELGPWKGIELPDHGEVWSIPWEYGLGGDLVRLWVHGIRFPYRLEKRVYLEEKRIFMKYRAQNLSPFDLDFIWAAHPLFNATEGMELIVPAGMNRIVNSVSGPRLGSYGSVYDFPSANLDDGKEFTVR